MPENVIFAVLEETGWEDDRGVAYDDPGVPHEYQWKLACDVARAAIEAWEESGRGVTE